MSAVGQEGRSAVPFILAERGTRLAAASVDDLILLAACLPAIFGAVPRMAAAVADMINGADIDPYALLLPMLSGVGAVVSLVALIAWAVITTWLVDRNGQTLGKRLMGIKVVRKNGARASLSRIFWLRNVLNSVFGYLWFVGLAYQLIDPLLIFQESRQCLHDRIADTIVIKV